MALKSSQNPNIPTPVNPTGIDATIYSINEQLVDKVAWLEYGYGKAYQKLDNTLDKYSGYFPLIYRGKIKNDWRYFNAIPDNDKIGQVFFLVKSRKYPTLGNNWGRVLIEYKIAMIFSVNLNIIDSALLETEIFTENLIRDIRECLINGNIRCSNFRIQLDSVTDLFKEVFAEFPLPRKQEKVEKAPKAHFRFNLTIEQWEEC
jgi:hypothetical protein